MEKIDVRGRVMWQSSDGEIRKRSDEKPDKYGWKKISIDGKVMWESPEGEREF